MIKLRQQPQRDEAGNVVPHDHLQIGNGHGVVRRIPAEQVVVRSDGRRTLSSQCFKPSSDPHEGLSVDLKDWMVEDGMIIKDFLTSDRFPGAVIMSVALIRDIALKVGWDPIEGDGERLGNPYHGEIWGIGRNNKAKQKQVQALARWLFPLDGVDVT